MVRGKKARAPARYTLPRAAYGVISAGPLTQWWCVWLDHEGHLQRTPDASGFSQALAQSPDGVLIESIARFAMGAYANLDLSPGGVAVGAWLNAHTPGGQSHAIRDDGGAMLAYRKMGSPQAPASNAQTPPQASREIPWWAGELGVDYPATRNAVVEAYRKRAHETHPDKHAGSDRAFKQMQRAYREALVATESAK